MNGTHTCGQRVRWVHINRVTVAVEPVHHERGDVEVPINERHSIAYDLPHYKAPRPGYNRHRRHKCPKKEAAA